MAGYLYKGDDTVGLGTHVVPTQVADVFEDSEQFPQQIYDVVH